MKELLLLLPFAAAVPAASAQDLYDVDVLRTIHLEFHDADWWTLLKQSYASQTNILADLTVEGVVYPDVGVRIRGNTSYIGLPAGSQKVSLNVTADFTHSGQDVLGYKNLNFNNSFLDPTFCREVVYHNVLARWIPSGRANHVVLTLNGENWGVYANVQQYDKTLLKEFFADEDGMRVKCANNPFGPGLQYMGTTPSAYSSYEIKDDGGLPDPVGALIAVCDAVDNTPPASWPLIDQVFAIDPSIWTVVLENLYSDDDGYVNKGCDFVMYRDPVDGRMHLHQTDGNESWTEESWPADYNLGAASKPFLSNVLSDPGLRGRYFAHLRAALEELDWSVLGPEFLARRNLIAAAVQADPKKLYSYDDFLANFTQTVSIGGFFGGPVIGLQEYVTQRRALLLATPEVAAQGPVIQGAAASSDVIGQPVYVTASVSGADPVAAVDLWYRPDPGGTYLSTPMAAAGDGVYGALLPLVGTAGQKVTYYVGATAQNAFQAQSFLPVQAELAPLLLAFQGGAVPSDVVINEFLAQNNTVIQDPFGAFEDYVELYNKGTTTIDLSGMYMSDSFLTPTEWQFPAGITLAPGETLLIWADEDLDEGPLHADFKLSAGGEEIGLWDTDGITLLDSVVFGPQMVDVSTGRLHDGGDLVVTFPVPTPAALNDGGCGLRAYDQLDPFGHPLGLSASGTGSIGTVVTLTGTGFQPSSIGNLVLGLAPAHTPVAGTGVTALLGGPTLIPLPTDATGTMTVPIAIPATPALIDLDVYCQLVGLDALGSLAGSNALHLSICP